MSDEYIPMSKKDIPLKDMCKQFMIDLRIYDRKLKYSEYEYEDSHLASCTIDFRDDALDKYLVLQCTEFNSPQDVRKMYMMIITIACLNTFHG